MVIKTIKPVWMATATKYSDGSIAEELWQEIESCYSEPNRYYHTLEHLQYMIDKSIELQNHIKDYDAVLFAIFYHDIIFTVDRSDDEEQSAALAEKRLAELGVPGDKIRKCRKMILASKFHEDSDDNDTRYFIDLDLAYLGDSGERYRRYARNIRKEYTLLPEDVFNKERRNVLEHYLRMDRIYKTDKFYRFYEKQARQNLRRELTNP